MDKTIIQMTPEQLQLDREKLASEVAEKTRKSVIEEMKSLNPFQKIEPKFVDKNAQLVDAITMMAIAKKSGKSVDDVAKESSLESHKEIAEMLSKSGTTFVGGESIVPVQFLDGIIPQLFDASVFLDKMPRIQMMSDRVTQGKEEWLATAYWADEIDETSKASMAEFGDINLHVKNVTADVIIPNNKLIASIRNGVAVESGLINNLINRLRLAAENKILYGLGTANTPLGINNRMLAGNKFSSSGTTAENMHTDVMKALNLIESSNVAVENPQLIWSSRTKNFALAGKTTLGMPYFPEMFAANPNFAGIAYGTTNAILNTYGSTTNVDIAGTGAKSHVWLIDWSKFLLGVFQDMVVTVGASSYRDSTGADKLAENMDVTVIKAKFKFDFGMFYSAAAAKIENVGYSL